MTPKDIAKEIEKAITEAENEQSELSHFFELATLKTKLYKLLYKIYLDEIKAT